MARGAVISLNTTNGTKRKYFGLKLKSDCLYTARTSNDTLSLMGKDPCGVLRCARRLLSCMVFFLVIVPKTTLEIEYLCDVYKPHFSAFLRADINHLVDHQTQHSTLTFDPPMEFSVSTSLLFCWCNMLYVDRIYFRLAFALWNSKNN